MLHFVDPEEQERRANWIKAPDIHNMVDEIEELETQLAAIDAELDKAGIPQNEGEQRIDRVRNGLQAYVGALPLVEEVRALRAEVARLRAERGQEGRNAT